LKTTKFDRTSWSTDRLGIFVKNSRSFQLYFVRLFIKDFRLVREFEEEI